MNHLVAELLKGLDHIASDGATLGWKCNSLYFQTDEARHLAETIREYEKVWTEQYKALGK